MNLPAQAELSTARAGQDAAARGSGIECADPTPLLEVRDLRVAFGAQTVLHGLNFSMAPGEKLALVGESGSGKTVCALSLLGLAQGARVSGSARFQRATLPGKHGPGAVVDLLRLAPEPLRALRGQDIAMVFQEPMNALNPVFTIGEQIAEVLRCKRGLNAREAWAGAVALLADMEIDEPQRRARAYAHQLSGGQRQRAMIAMALACRPRLLLADEPTTALDVTLRAQILDLLERLRQRDGMAILLVTHDLHLVRRFADRVAVMERGHIVEQGVCSDLFSRPAHARTRALQGSAPQRDPTEASSPAPAEDAVRATQLQVHYLVPRAGLLGWFRPARFDAVQDVSWRLPAGRTLGVVGESGSGKSTLALAALGLLPFAGELAVFGRPWAVSPAQDLANRRALQVVFQDPFSALSPRLHIQDIVGEGLRIHAPELTAGQRHDRVLAALKDVGLEEAQFPGLLQRYAHQFSGGQRQRIAIARALVLQPRALVLDEPTSALDASMARQVLALLQKLQAVHGLAYLLISHDVAVIRAMAHTVLVLRQGRVVESGPVDTVFEHAQHPYTQALVQAAL